MELKCEYKDCKEVKTGVDVNQCIELMKLHHSGHHPAGTTTTTVVKEEVKERRVKRAKVKPPVFLEKETREEFRRKYSEFQSYSDRTKLQGEEVTDDLYQAC